MLATDPAMIRVMNGTAFQAMAMITPSDHSSRTSFGSCRPNGRSMRDSIAAAVEQDHDDEGGDDRRHDQRHLVERREQALSRKARLQRYGERHGDERG